MHSVAAYSLGFLDFLLIWLQWSVKSWSSSPNALSVSRRASQAAQVSKCGLSIHTLPRSAELGHCEAGRVSWPTGPTAPNMSPQELDPGVLAPSLPRSQFDLAGPGSGATELKALILLLFDQMSCSSLSLCTLAYFTRELQQSLGHNSSWSLEESSPWLSPETYINEQLDNNSSKLQVLTLELGFLKNMKI